MLSLKGIRSTLDLDDFEAIANLRQLEELVLDCDQPPEPEPGLEEIKWGLPEFPEGMLHLVNMTHLTLSCHYGITELPHGITSLNKLEVWQSSYSSFSASCALQHVSCCRGLGANTDLTLVLSPLPVDVSGHICGISVHACYPWHFW